MSRSPYFFVEKYDNKTGKYVLQHPYVWNWNHTELIPADLFPYNGCHDLFALVEGQNCDTPMLRGINYGLPVDTCDEIKKALEDCSWTAYNGEEVKPTVRSITYADIYIYCIEHPTVTEYSDYDEEEKRPIERPTPLATLKDRVASFMEVVDGWDWQDHYSQIRIVYWIE